MEVREDRLLLNVPWDVEGMFVERPNRFLGVVEIGNHDGLERVKVHVHDPGRLPDILVPGKRVRLRYAPGAGRKTKWDLIAGENAGRWVFVHSGYHRKICEELFKKEDISPFKRVKELTAEVKVGKSRIDFLVETEDRGPVWVETKGCTLARGDIATFPDAPTARGAKHVEELISIKKQGSCAAILFLVFRSETSCFLPNREVDTLFDEVFWKAIDSGVEARFLVLEYFNKGIYFKREIPLCT